MRHSPAHGVAGRRVAPLAEAELHALTGGGTYVFPGARSDTEVTAFNPDADSGSNLNLSTSYLPAGGAAHLGCAAER